MKGFIGIIGLLVAAYIGAWLGAIGAGAFHAGDAIPVFVFGGAIALPAAIAYLRKL